MNSAYVEQYGQWALVTGAAEGLGAEFARQLAERGLDVLLADVQAEKAEQQAAKLRDEYGVDARALDCDLAQPDFLVQLQAQTAGLNVGMLVCCAGIGATGEFLSCSLASMRRAIQINCMATMELAYHYAPAMVERKRGGIIIIASNAGYAGAPYIANYSGTKAYDLCLAEGLWYELGEYGVDVLGFAPQGTNTPGYRRGSPSVSEGDHDESLMLPQTAVELALGKLGKIASFRPDMPEEFSLQRQKILKVAGDFTRQLADHQG